MLVSCIWIEIACTPSVEVAVTSDLIQNPMRSLPEKSWLEEKVFLMVSAVEEFTVVVIFKDWAPTFTMVVSVDVAVFVVSEEVQPTSLSMSSIMVSLIAPQPSIPVVSRFTSIFGLESPIPTLPNSSMINKSPSAAAAEDMERYPVVEEAEISSAVSGSRSPIPILPVSPSMTKVLDAPAVSITQVVEANSIVEEEVGSPMLLSMNSDCSSKSRVRSVVVPEK